MRLISSLAASPTRAKKEFTCPPVEQSLALASMLVIVPRPPMAVCGLGDTIRRTTIYMYRQFVSRMANGMDDQVSRELVALQLGKAKETF